MNGVAQMRLTTATHFGEDFADGILDGFIRENLLSGVYKTYIYSKTLLHSSGGKCCLI
jgi:hypothetical protein